MRSKAIFLICALGFLFSKNAGAQIDSLDQESRNEPPKGMEIISKRTWNSKTFLNADNTVTVEISSGYLHYRDRDGRFQEIDRRIVVSPDSTSYQVTKGLYAANFGFDLQKEAYPISFEMSDSTRFRAKLTSLAYYNRASKQIVTLEEVRDIKGIVNGNKIRYPEAFNGVDVEFEYLDAKLKQYAYLSQKARDNLPDPESLGLNPNNTDLVLVTQIDLPDSLEAFANNTKISTKPQGKIRLAFEGEDGVEFRNTGGKLKFLLPADFAFANAGRDSASEESSSRRMWRRFYSSGNNNLMLTGVSVKWLDKQPEGTIVLDPTVSLTPPTDDVWIEYNSYTNFDSYTQIRIGRGDWYGWKRSLVRFDVSAIPQNATIQSATLQLYFYGKYGTTIVNRTIQCHQVLQQWYEGYANWFYRYGGATWNVPGVGFDGIDAKVTPEDAQNWYNEYPTWKSYNITALTQQWANGTQPNYGVIFWATNEDDYTDADEKWCYSSEYSDATKRPKLVVTISVNPLVDIAYDALSRPTTITYANGVTETNLYDVNRGWMTRRDYQKSGSNIYYFKSDLATDFDKAGNLKHVEYKHKSDAAQTMDYVYNRLYRLTQFTPSGGAAKSYGYDRNGNLNSFEGLTFTYPNKNNQLKEVKNGSTVITTYLYDKAGRVNQINSTSVTHNLHSNMTAHGSNTYAYDAFSQRIRKTESGVSKYYITSGPQVLAEYSNNSGPDAEYIYALGRMISKFDPSKGYLWFYVDHLGSTRLVDGPDSQTDMRRDYYPYGQAYLAAGTDQAAYQFTGKELDNVTGLYYFGARYYERSIGRWLVPDPIVSDFSPYSYAHNSPLQYVDPDGQSWFPVWLGLNLVNLFFNEARGPRVRNGSIGGNSYLNPGIRPTFGRSGFVDDFSGR
ncbi:DNRLRE domain-containing protein, partial [candidate division KSB1 bacterium]|nr:DNRLRE domain-containing protein [candidate division KSB1 bacterium]